MNRFGTQVRKLTNDSGVIEGLDYSPDGDKIAFTSEGSDGNLEIFTIDADGRSPANVTNDPAADAFPSWSPDGEMLAFASSRDGDFDVYVVRPDGSELVQLTTDEPSDVHPVFSPSGTRIAFASDRDDSAGEVYTMNVDGTAVVRVTNSLGADAPFSWRGRSS